MDYATVKTVHQTAALLSFVGFFARGCGVLCRATWVYSRPAKTLPHIVDTVLLGSALVLAWSLRLDPLGAPWLLAKIAALAAYIGLGVVALRPGRSVALRAVAWVAALLTFAYIVSVAVKKDPLGFLAAFF